MCRCTESEAGGFLYAPSWRISSEGRTSLKIRTFHLRLAICAASARIPLPETLTLVYFPRAPGTPLEINGSKARPGSPALLSLHRVRSAEHGPGEAAFASTDRVWTGDGTSFEVYAGEHRAVTGVFREGGKGGEESAWGMECRYPGEMDRRVFGLESVEVRVVREGGAVMREEVEMPVSRKRAGRRRGGGGQKFCSKLAGIPEEEAGADGSGCRCSCCGEREGEEQQWEMVGSSEEEEDDEEDGVTVDDLEVDGVQWAVDVGIWVMCLGVGLLVSKASSASSKRRRGFLF